MNNQRHPRSRKAAGGGVGVGEGVAMSEEEWLAATDPNKLLGQVRNVTGRRFRLLSAAAVSLVENMLSAHVCHLAGAMSLRLAEEYVPEAAQEDLRHAVWEYIRANAGKRPQPSVNADSA